MLPKAVSDAGYTAVGLGVLALQQVQIRRRETRARLEGQLAATRHNVQSAVGTVKATVVEPLAGKLETPVSAVLDRIPRLPGAVGDLVEGGRERIQATLRPATRPVTKPVAAAAGQARAKGRAATRKATAATKV